MDVRENTFEESDVDLRTASLRAPVTAATFLSPGVVAVGHGNRIEVFGAPDGELLSCLTVFRAGTDIKGFDVCLNRLVVHGDRFVAVIRFDLSQTSTNGEFRSTLRLTPVCENKMDDWVVHATCVPSDESHGSGTLVVLTAHNRLHVVDMKSRRVDAESQCEDQSVIVCGKVLLESMEDPTFLVLAGTMFSEILMWTCSAGKPSSIVQRLKGHAGILFSVDVDAVRRSVVSASDDRAVCVWRAADPLLPLGHPTQKFDLVGPLYGHEARVWRASFLGSSAGGGLSSSSSVVSVGEDSRVCLWDAMTGQLRMRFVAHGGAFVRCLAVSEWDSSFVTGGADGSVKYFPSCEVPRRSEIPIPAPADGAVRSVQCVDGGGRHLLVALVSGELLLVRVADGAVLWRRRDESASLRGYSCVDVRRCSDDDGELELYRVAAGGLGGSVSVFSVARDPSGKWEAAVGGSDVSAWDPSRGTKVAFVKWLVGGSLVVSGADGSSVLFGDPLRSSASYDLTVPGRSGHESCITAGAMSGCGSLLVVGHRDGGVHLFVLHPSSQKCVDAGDRNSTWAYVEGVPRLFGKHGVTSVVHDPERQVFWTGGRNGTICAFRASSDAGLELLERTAWKRDWIGGFRVDRGELRIISFYSRFCLLEDERGEELVRVDCGGGHRSWDLAVAEDADRTTSFFFVKEGRLFSETTSRRLVTSPTVFKKSVARSTVNAAAAFSDTHVAMGMEDGTVSFAYLNTEEHGLETVGRSIAHLSSVKSVAVRRDRESGGASAHLLAFGGGRALIVLYRLAVLEGDASSRRADVFSTKLTEVYAAEVGDGRKKSNKPWRGPAGVGDAPPPPSSSSECRVNSLRFSGTELLLAGCSDGFVRAFAVELSSSSSGVGGAGRRQLRCDVTPTWKTELTSCAVTGCLGLVWSAGILCGGSDGVLRVYAGGGAPVDRSSRRNFFIGRRGSVERWGGFG